MLEGTTQVLPIKIKMKIPIDVYQVTNSRGIIVKTIVRFRTFVFLSVWFVVLIVDVGGYGRTMFR